MKGFSAGGTEGDGKCRGGGEEDAVNASTGAGGDEEEREANISDAPALGGINAGGRGDDRGLRCIPFDVDTDQAMVLAPGDRSFR